MRKLKDTNPTWRNIGFACILFVILAIVVSVMLYPVYREYDWDYDYLEENWFDTTKRPYDVHGLENDDYPYIHELNEGESNEME